MKSTENLKLNLYEAGDYILHDNFNRDNEKIDAAVMANRSFHLLKEWTVSESAMQVSFDLSGIQWEDWQAIHLDILGRAKESSPLDLYFNGDRSSKNLCWRLGYSNGEGGTLARLSAGSDGIWADRVTLEVGCQAERSVRAISCGSVGRHEDLRYSQLKTLHLVSSQSILSGSRVILWGEK